MIRNENYFLNDPMAKKLYFETAKDLPIIDYHNHLPVGQLKSDEAPENIFDLWIKPDPYKHRLMRIAGVPERLITGDAEDREKFEAWCRIYPLTAGTPVFEWCREEAFMLFGDCDLFTSDAKKLWDIGNSTVKNGFKPSEILSRFGVEYAAPCCSLTDDVSFFEADKMLAPSLRGDDAVLPDLAFTEKLSAVSKENICSLGSYTDALYKRIDAFHEAGCRFSDHALDDGFRYYPDDGKNGERFINAVNGTASFEERSILRSEILRRLAHKYREKGWVMQLHIGALRNTSERLKKIAGPQGGFAGIGTATDISEISTMLNGLEVKDSLPKTVLFNLDPSQSEAMAVLSGSFSRDGVPSLVSEGPAWWWCDHFEGITKVLDAVSCYSLLSGFIGMTTDSRSFMSFVRHDYFRRCLCRYIAKKVRNDRLPDDGNLLKEIITRVCYTNAKTLLYKGEKE